MEDEKDWNHVDNQFIYDYKDYILSSVGLLDVVKAYNIPVMEAQSGSFTHKTTCPFKMHKKGREKTASFFIDSINNTFYCFGCLEENELVLTDNGLVPIKNIHIGDNVIDLYGNVQKVSCVIPKVKTIGGIITKTFRNDPLKLTYDHKCLWVKLENVLELSYISKRKDTNSPIKLNIKNKKNNISNILKIYKGNMEEIKKDDFLIFPVIKNELRKKSIVFTAKIKPYTKGPKTKRIESLHLNKKTARLYGLWLAEGSAFRGGIRFTFCLDEKNTLATEVVDILKTEFDSDASIFSYIEKNVCEVICSKTDLQYCFEQTFGSGAEIKHIPNEIMYAEQEIQWELIKGFIDGDGNGINNMVTISKRLAYCLYNIIIQTGKCPSLRKYDAQNKNGINHKEYWLIKINKENINGFFEYVDDNLYFLNRVDKIEFVAKDQRVVDITVENTHTFLTKMCATHNCNQFGNAMIFVERLCGYNFEPSHKQDAAGNEALKILARIGGLIDGSGSLKNIRSLVIEQEPYKETIDSIIFDCNRLLRDHLNKFRNTDKFDSESKWTDKMFLKLEQHFNKVDVYDIDKAQAIYNKLKETIDSR